jgi:hypothetical protein
MQHSMQHRQSLHHLTTQGWTESETRPSNAIEAWIRTTDNSPTGKLQIAYTRDWVHPDWSCEAVKELRGRFPRPETQVSGLNADISWEQVDCA